MGPPQWQVGDDVLCHGRRATVRYVGETFFARGTWVGVEFSKVSAGRNNGRVDDVQYFGPTEPNHGLFLPLEDEVALRPFSPQDEAAAIIQAQVRRKQEAEAAHYAQVCRAFNAIESMAESERLRSNEQSVRAAHALKDEGACGGVDGSLKLAEVLAQQAASEVSEALTARTGPCLPTAPAPHIRFEAVGDSSHLHVPWHSVMEVLAHVKQPDAATLDSACVMRLIRQGVALYRQKVTSAVQELSTPSAPGRLLVVGDTHGQLEDVLWIFFEHGLPSADNVYLFNGDVCDRGSGAVEIMVLILMFKLWDPRCIFMNRGNHEDPCMNESYGFCDECEGKWGQGRGTEVFDAFNSFFQLLPIFTIVDASIFVVHGGLFRKDFSLTQLRRATFRRSLPEKPGVGMDVLLFDSVWADPQKNRGVGSNSRGDSIITFGEDVTRRFLRANGLRLLVRSHQVPDSGQGYEWWHGGKCLTIFSASNYCGDCGNLGGVLVLTQGEEEHISEHWAPSLEELQGMEAEADKAQARILRQAKLLSLQRQKRKAAVQRMEADIVRHVQEEVVRRKAELWEYWCDVDTSPRGVFRIPAALWREGCAAVIDGSLPWVRLQEVLGVADARGEVHYAQFLARYRLAFEASFGLATGGWEQAVWSKLMDTLLRSDLPLREALAALDATNDGLVSGVEFARLLDSARIGITGFQARTLLRSLAVHEEQGGEGAAGKVSVWDMLGRLQVTLPIPRAAAIDPEVEAWAVPKLRPLAAAVLDDAWKRLVPAGAPESEWPVPKLLAAWFEDVDASHNGFLETGEFVAALQRLGASLARGGCPTDIASLEKLVAYCDGNGNGHLNYFEVLNALSLQDSFGAELQRDLVESVHAAIYFNMAPIRRALQGFDATKTGLASPEVFVKALNGARAALGPAEGALTKSQIEAIAANLPRTEEGMINYDSFLRSFRVLDTMAVGVGETQSLVA